ncbi:uncharacterized protein [Lolium perenne]|uniref:uncharacterized protein isoform X2 n=1 Tax=Lolium perenne TaxID=4522 RepID=UPI003A9A3A39
MTVSASLPAGDAATCSTFWHSRLRSRTRKAATTLRPSAPPALVKLKWSTFRSQWDGFTYHYLALIPVSGSTCTRA